MEEVLHGTEKDNELRLTENEKKAYGWQGDDTLISDNYNEVKLIGGSGDDSLVMKGGTGTLSGGTGSDVFDFTYSAEKKISAVIEDFEPSSDSIIVNGDKIVVNGDNQSQLKSSIRGDDVVLTDNDGNFNVTVKTMAEVLHGTESNDQAVVTSGRTQAYGLKGDDTLINDNHNEVLLIGGSGDDKLIMMGGQGTLNGGAGKDVFDFTYSADKKVSAVIEDFNPSEDKIVVNYVGNDQPQLTPSTIGSDVVLSDNRGNFSITLKSARERENDYLDREVGEEIWEVLKLTNAERAMENLHALTLSEGLTKAATIRVEDIKQLDNEGAFTDHTRLNGDKYDTVIVDEDKKLKLKDKYHSYSENLDGGAESPEEVLKDWMKSDHHRINVLDEQIDENGQPRPFTSRKLGVGYEHLPETALEAHQDYWVQEFADSLTAPDISISTDKLLEAVESVKPVTISSKYVQLNDNKNKPYENDDYGVTIAGSRGNDSIKNTGAIVSINSGDGSDTIENSVSFTTINSGTGDDSISLSENAKEILIEYAAGDGSDTISGLNKTDTISISGDKFYTQNKGSNIIVAVGRRDSITLLNAENSGVQIKGDRNALYIGTEEDDTLENTIDNATIQALEGNDTINNSGSTVTIEAGEGDDSISNKGENVLFVYESGNDTIQGFNETSTLQISANNVTSLDSDGDLVFNIGEEKISLIGATRFNAINVFDANGKPLEVKDAKDVKGTEKADNINNTINGATIQAFGGDDTISNSGNKVTIIGGKDNDSINLSDDAKNNLILYAAGDGDDTITGFNETTTLSISGGKYSTQVIDEDIIVTVDENKITLQGAASLTPNIEGDTEDNFPSDIIKLGGLIPSDALQYNGHSYKLFDDGMTWEEAKAYCEALGGHLVVITDANEQDAIQNLLEEKGSKNNYWMGGFNNSGSWQWVTDETWSYDNWGWNQPDGDGSALMIYYSTANTWARGDWNDLSPTGSNGQNFFGTENLGIICEWETVRDPKLIILTADNDTYGNTIEGATILALGGNDSVHNYFRSNVSIDGGTGSDRIDNENGNSATIDGGTGNDFIWNNNGANVSINGGSGNDYIWSGYSSSVTINSGAGDDTIDNFCESVSIDGGTGADSISNGKSFVTIGGGADDDTISNDSENVTIDGGIDNDSIVSAGDMNWIFGGSGNDTIANSKTTINGSELTCDSVTIDGGEGKDFIYNWGSNVTIDGGADNDSIISTGDMNLIYGGEGNDSIENNRTTIEGSSELTTCDSVTIDGGAGEDSIKSDGFYVTINGGDGDDKIGNNGSFVTIDGGDGNDRITLSSNAKENVIEYRRGEGYDTIWGYEEDDSIRIFDNPGISTWISVRSGNDVIIKVGGENRITVKDGFGKKIHTVVGESGTTGGLNGDGGNNSSGGNDGGRGGNEGSDTSGGRSSEANSNANAVAGATSSRGSDGNDNSGDRGGNDIVRQNPSPTQTPTPNMSELHSYLDNAAALEVETQAPPEKLSLSFPTNWNFPSPNEIKLPSLILDGTPDNDELQAGVEGYQLWGHEGDDTLIGGDGYDVFFGGKDQGSDTFLNVSASDVVYLSDVTFNDLSKINKDGDTVNIAFKNGNSVTIQSTDTVSGAVVLGDLTLHFTHQKS